MSNHGCTSRTKKHVGGLPSQVDRGFSSNDNPSIGQALRALYDVFNNATYPRLEKATGISREVLEDLAAEKYTGFLSNPQFISLAKAARRLAMGSLDR